MWHLSPGDRWVFLLDSQCGMQWLPLHEEQSPLLCVCSWWSTCWRIWNGDGSAGSDGGLGSAGFISSWTAAGLVKPWALTWPCVNDPHGLISSYELSPQFIWPMFKMSVCHFPSSRPKQLFPMGTSLWSVKISQGFSQGILAKSVRTSLSSTHGAILCSCLWGQTAQRPIEHHRVSA